MPNYCVSLLQDFHGLFRYTPTQWPQPPKSSLNANHFFQNHSAPAQHYSYSCIHNSVHTYTITLFIYNRTGGLEQERLQTEQTRNPKASTCTIALVDVIRIQTRAPSTATTLHLLHAHAARSTQQQHSVDLRITQLQKIPTYTYAYTISTRQPRHPSIHHHRSPPNTPQASPCMWHAPRQLTDTPRAWHRPTKTPGAPTPAGLSLQSCARLMHACPLLHELQGTSLARYRKRRAQHAQHGHTGANFQAEPAPARKAQRQCPPRELLHTTNCRPPTGAPERHPTASRDTLATTAQRRASPELV